jgi:hypothetical protein
MSAKARAAISRAQKKRWAKFVLFLLPVLTTLAAAQSTPPLGGREAQDFSFLSGRWSVETAPPTVEPRFEGSLQIAVNGREILIQRGMFPMDTFRTDGTPTELADGRAGSMLVIGDGIVFVTRRARQLPAGPSTTIYTDVYRVNGNLLTVDSLRTQSQADGTLARIDMADARVTIRYRRLP